MLLTSARWVGEANEEEEEEAGRGEELPQLSDSIWTPSDKQTEKKKKSYHIHLVNKGLQSGFSACLNVKP